ncbi:polyprenyl synthetase family protein [Halovulum dunhuangense]|uniref:Geranylgeranyl diphosphate synthase n=1 Tax=Halovulum dunhuangense TaxID=1505036 RepID=A0A849KZM9_9RHOB|nr:polyprenyl synthetase family protein [Halovulum dunhuangense]NNU79344.1 polyprenyl synthetase family protein [Halovulum dunhuangense]
MPDRIETALMAALTHASGPSAPPLLAGALQHAVFPGGARVRPQLCLAVAAACGDDRPTLSDAAAASIELIHCASLVHDDMPCFDDADLRRGKPTVHAAYSEPLALLAGDALIVLAFEILARAAIRTPARLPGMVVALASHTGMPGGICAGQGWESEASVDLSLYHRAKTGSLFVAATTMGAQAAGAEPEPWVELGARIGEAFQVADDLRDALLTQDELGKPAGQDVAHHRPNAVSELGVKGAVQKLHDILGGAIASIPSCPGEARLCEIVSAQAKRLTPVEFARALA